MHFKLSTRKALTFTIKWTYTLSYTHYPQVFLSFKWKKTSEESEQMFCEVVIKLSKQGEKMKILVDIFKF